MHQVKIFKGIENDVASLEKQMNAWLASESVRVLNIFGNIAPQTPPPPANSGSISQGAWPPSDVLLIVHYEK